MLYFQISFISLRAEWLYSQGKGRKFRVGEHSALVQYLIDTCPMSGKALESENERKLRLILSKAQQHQKQLSQEQPSECVCVLFFMKKILLVINFLRILFSRYSQIF